jgi:hypothetical protein
MSNVPPRLLEPGYTTHDAHGYRNGLGACACQRCVELRNQPAFSVPQSREVALTREAQETTMSPSDRRKGNDELLLGLMLALLHDARTQAEHRARLQPASQFVSCADVGGLRYVHVAANRERRTGSEAV